MNFTDPNERLVAMQQATALLQMLDLLHRNGYPEVMRAANGRRTSPAELGQTQDEFEREASKECAYLLKNLFPGD